MNIPLVTVFIFAAMIATFSLSQVYAEPVIYDDDYIVEKFVSSLGFPTTMTFVGDEILILEKSSGNVIRIQDNGVPYPEPVLHVPVEIKVESGLLGISKVSNHVFLYYTEPISGYGTSYNELSFSYDASRNVVYQYDWNGEKLTNPVLIKEFPALNGYHNGGVMTKGLNNEIYFVIGDLDQRTVFQNIPGENADFETGSIFKIDTESNNVELYAMGIRNSFGLAVDPITGYLWDTENGPDVYDEINLVEPKFNSGWIEIQGPSNGKLLPQLSKYKEYKYSEPEFSWELPIGVTAIAFPEQGLFEKYFDWLFVGDFHNGIIYKFKLDDTRTKFIFKSTHLQDNVLNISKNSADAAYTGNTECRVKDYLCSLLEPMNEIVFAKDFQGITDIKFHNGAMYIAVIGEDIHDKEDEGYGDGSIYKIYPKDHLSPLKQYQNGVTHKNIVCDEELMPIMSKSGSIYCVQPRTAITLVNVLNWSIEHSDMPKIELKNQDLHGLNFEHINLSYSDFRGSDFDNAKITDANFARANLSDANLLGMDLTGTILTGADLSDANLAGVDLSGMDLTETRLIGTDLSNAVLTGTILTGADLSETNLTGVDLSGMNLSGVRLAGVDLSNEILADTILTGADLSETNLTGIDLSGMDLTGTILSGADLSNVVITGTVLTGADLSDANLAGIDLSGMDLTKMKLIGADLSNAVLTETIMAGADFRRTNLAGVDLSSWDLTGTILSSADLTNAVLPSDYLSQNDFTSTVLDGVDLSGKDLTGSVFNIGSFKNTNLQNANLSAADFVQVDFTEIKNKSLAGADLSHASFAHSNLIGVSLDNAILKGSNFYNSNLSGQDFTDISNNLVSGSLFINAKLSNSDFEGVDLSPQEYITTTFKNKAFAINLEGESFSESIFSESVIPIQDYLHVISKEVRGNDLVVSYLLFNNFREANLESANFKNAGLVFANFYQANLTNADLSGADLRKAFLGNADLTNANLDGADLQDATLDTAILSNANLRCVNHPICQVP